MAESKGKGKGGKKAGKRTALDVSDTTRVPPECIPPEGDHFVPNGPFGTMWYDSGAGPVKIDPPAGDPSTWDACLCIGPLGPYWKAPAGAAAPEKPAETAEPTPEQPM
jgi:hypothetical protein